MIRCIANDLERLRLVLADHRRAGTPFEVAWLRAIAGVREREMRHALIATAEAWSSAYNGQPPTRGEDAAALLEAAP